MSEEENSKKISSWPEVAYSNMIGNEALVRLLVRQGIITKEDFSEEVRKVHQAFQQQQASSSGSEG